MKLMLSALYILVLALASQADDTIDSRPRNDFKKGKYQKAVRTDAVTGDEMQKRLMEVDDLVEETPVKKREIVTVIQKHGDAIENPGDVLARYNRMKPTGAGALVEDDGRAAHCVPNLKRNPRQPASQPRIEGFKCTQIDPASGLKRAGLLDGDIIKSVDGKKIDSPKFAVKLIRKIEDGDYSRIVIVRDGREAILASPLR